MERQKKKNAASFILDSFFPQTKHIVSEDWLSSYR